MKLLKWHSLGDWER